MESSPREPVAIIGSGCRFPGEASSPSRLWELLAAPRDVLVEIPPARFVPEGYYHEDGEYHGSTNVKESYLLSEDHRLFDPHFFKIKPVEAHCMDPQQRLLMETVYEGLEASGLTIEGMQGSDTAVYVGLMCEEYSAITACDIDQLPTYTATATARSIMSNRVSYFFDWHGPCMTIDTACSSSLVAVHQAVETLRNGTSRVAIAAGSNLLLGPTGYITESKLHMLSPGSRSRMWDVDADGYARGEGVACLVLKKLSDALRDGDHIECLIRETGVNQDGRTTGITMPSSIAQETLIRSTYARAGLDITKAHDRCQFFEAHGTGTPAGDPIEASAIHNAFFGSDNKGKGDDKLYVGSVKTVIGHTEGTAGIAAIMKASLAIQHATIPPNLLFKTLSPAVQPFYDNLEIITSPQSWPILPDGVPRRASVNSFGFGGTNAHAILEEWTPEKDVPGSSIAAPVFSFIPFCISAASETSLYEQARRLKSWLVKNPKAHLSDLAWTLSCRRSSFAHRWHFAATNSDQLCSQIEKSLGSPYENIAFQKPEVKILGVFTGQGAQWPTMAKCLILTSKFAEAIVDNLESSLASLPDAPSWSLKAEMLSGSTESRVSEAEISQPLCTAVQILLVEMLRISGIKFSAVVGHSSGEIAAAYTAGFLTAEDAIRIAFYRGLHTNIAGGRNGERGAMLAVGTSLEDAQELCEFEELQGRITVAASNSSSSTTLSGDADAIQEALEVMQDEKKFARLLRVDKAYHSHHMDPCSGPYLESLHQCAIQVGKGDPACAWLSSVKEGKISCKESELAGEYWKNNMIQSVLFGQAVRTAIETQGPFDIAIEVGPHPALQGPALQNIQDVTGNRIPYTGLLARDTDDVESFAAALGYLWRHSALKVEGMIRFDQTMSGGQNRKVQKGLPSYAFDHDKVYWYESRLSKTIRTRKAPYHELLGVLCPDGTDSTLLRWKNLLNPKEIPWLSGHAVQGQIVFPAAGYMSMAIDACRLVAPQRQIQSLELVDFVIGKAIIFDERSLGVEILLVLSLDDELDGKKDSFQGTVRISAGASGAETTSLIPRSSCRVRVVYGEPVQDLLPPRAKSITNFVNVDSDQFYNHLAKVGYMYSGPFRGLSSLKRTLDAGTGLITNPARSDSVRSPTAHPATLDCAIQAALVGFCYPGDGKLHTLHVPTKIKRIIINMPYLEHHLAESSLLPVDSIVNETGIVSGDVQLFAADSSMSLMQFEGIEVIPLSPPTADHDAQMFFTFELDVATPDGERMMRGRRATTEDYLFSTVCERIAYFYLKQLLAELSIEEIKKAKWHHKRLIDFARKALDDLRSGLDPMVNTKWYDDSRHDIYAMMSKYKHKVEIELARAVGENLPAAVRGETVILEHMMKNNVLNDVYTRGLGFGEYSHFLSEAVVQLGHRYPHMNILEIGAGTGGATKLIIPKLDKAFSSYTFTDISGGFFPNAQDVFRSWSDCMIYKVLDVEKDVVEQGYQEHSYDLVIASLVIHATKDIGNAIRNVRRLLKPGGFFALLELTNLRPIRVGFCMSGLEGWWLGAAEDGRQYGPCIDANRWNCLLQDNGFSCIDAITPDLDPEPWPFNIIVAQAIDDRVAALRNPLYASVPDILFRDLFIVGGKKLHTSLLADKVDRLLSQKFERIHRVTTLEELVISDIGPRATVLSLTDFDSPMFNKLTDDRLESFKRLLDSPTNILWVTTDARTDPYTNMIVGFGRTAAVELPGLRLQFLDFSNGAKPTADALSEVLLRLILSNEWEEARQNGEILWSVERELYADGDQIWIPRLLASKDRNDRYNSTRRDVPKCVSLSENFITVSSDKGWHSLEEGSRLLPAIQEGMITVRPSHSILQPLRIAASGSFYISSGTLPNSGKYAFFLSETLSSPLTVPTRWVLPFDCSASCSAGSYLASFAGNALAKHIIADMNKGSQLVAHEVPPFLVEPLVSWCESQGVSLLRTTCATAKDFRGNILYIHPRITARRLKTILPKLVSRFINFSLPGTIGYDVGNIMSSRMNQHYHIVTTDDVFNTEVMKNHSTDLPELCGLQQLASQVRASEKILDESPFRDISSLASTYPLGEVVSWPENATIKIANVDAYYKFKEDRTYLLFGLSGQLGKSLCTWMVRHGARNVVLTSRHPEVDGPWVREMETLGAVIRFKSNDITNRSAVEDLISDIRATMPPIAGVANGAMILQDTAIREMTTEVLNKVLKPKVDGSRHIDEILQADQLDFFVLFSSLATVFGNHGQSNYTAANMFMNALAGQRRKKGQAASVIAIGAVTGIGYMARELSEKHLIRIKGTGYSSMSERDFHQLFCEGIVAGNPESGLNLEVISGVQIGQSGDKRPDVWHTNPMFGHCIVKRDELRKDDLAHGLLPLKTSLLDVKTREEVLRVISESFVHRLQGMLQSDQDIPFNLAADELGVDSLVAVDIRSWFLKEVNVDLPVLKILGGASVGDMLEYAVDNIPHEMIPNVPEILCKEPDEPLQLIVPPVLTPGLTTGEIGNYTTSAQRSSESSSGIDDSINASSIDLHPSDGSLTDEEAPLSNPVIRAAPMSLGQSRFWFLQKYLADKTAFNIVTMITIQGKLRVSELSNAVTMVGRHHEALRTKFYIDVTGQHMQGIMKEPNFSLQLKRVISPDDTAKEFDRIKNYKYDLETGDIMQISLLSSPTTHYLTIGYHHINMDGISLGVLLADIHTVYRGTRLSPTLQYPVYSDKQHDLITSGAMKDEKAFWAKEFKTLPPVLPLLPFSMTKSRRPLDRYDAHVVELTIPLEIAAQIKRVVQEHRVSPFHVYLTVFRVLLMRIMDVKDIVIGMGDANRTESGAQSAIGMYLNLLPLRFESMAKQTFATAIKEAQSKVRKALAHSRLAFDSILEILQPPRSTDSAPLFQVFIDYRPPMPDRSRLFDCQILEERYARGDTAYDVALDIIDTLVGDAHIQFTVPKLLYSKSDVQILLTTFERLLETFTANPGSDLTRVPLYSDDDIKRALILGRGPSVESKWQSLPLRLKRITRDHTELNAVRDGHGHSLTYGQLEARMTTISSTLSASGAKTGSVVAVLLEPQVDWAASVLAILRAGLVYVPLDARTPPSRLSAILQECQPSVVLFHHETRELVESLQIPDQTRLVAVDTVVADGEESYDLDADADADSNTHRACFILYTSGSSGIPKGVVLKQSNLLNQIENTVNYYELEPGWTVLQQTAYSFDISLWQLLIAMTSGASIYIVPQHLRGDALAISRIIETENINITGGTPSQYSSWLRHGDGDAIRRSSWRVVNCGGEALTPALEAEFRSLAKSDLRLYNAYAPCEATFVSNEIEIKYHDKDDSSVWSVTPVGFSLPNYSVYILDENLKPVPIGIKGQIAIGGAGVAAGYLDSHQDQDIFIPNPYATDSDISHGWSTIYLTGDEGVLRADGALVFVSRRLSQNEVKIRGMRFDLQDVEMNLVQTAGGVLAQAVVSLRGNDDAQFLVAHVTFANGQVPGEQEVFFQRLLTDLPVPSHMKPAIILDVEEIPLTFNSKVDRAAVGQLRLPDSSSVALKNNDELSEVEAKMLDLWRQILPTELLKLKPLGPDSDFFNVGGNSLLLVRLQADIQRNFDSLLPLTQLFEMPTIRGMASRLSPNQRHEENGPIDWDEETQLSIMEPQSVFGVSLESEVRNVVITGSTGFLGRAIVAELLEDPRIDHIDCIAVRERSDRPLPIILSSSPKIQVHSGDLTQPQLGLSVANAAAIFNRAHVVIHNAADVSFMKSYHSLRPSNVAGTRALLDLIITHATPRRVPIHFVSSAAVAQLAGGGAFGEMSVAALRPPSDGSNGYMAAKWASERILELAHAQLGVPIWIHRPSSIMGEDAPETDLMANLLRYSLALKALPMIANIAGESSSAIKPDVPITESYLDFVDVHTTAKGIVRRVLAAISAEEAELVKYTYHSGEYVIPMSALLQEREEVVEGIVESFALLPLPIWVSRAKGAGMNQLVVALLDAALSRGGGINDLAVFPQLIKGESI